MFLCVFYPGARAAEAPVILVLGDSLSAGYGLNANDGWVSRLERKLKTQGYPQQLVNASVSGETTAGGKTRLPVLLARHQPQLVLIELGGNDGLRGLPVNTLKNNLGEMIRLSQAAHAGVLLFEMRIPSNYGPAYTAQFTQAFADVARSSRVSLLPFFLAAIATDARYFQDDGIHPNAGAQPLLLDAVWPALEPLLKPKSPAN